MTNQTFTAPCILSGVISFDLPTLAKALQPYLAAPGPAPTPTPTPTPLPSGVTWMYLNGVQTLAGDFTGNGETVDYERATTAGFNGGTKCILVTSSVPWGYFIPYWAANYQLPNPGFTKLLLSLKPTITGDTFGIHAERVGDVGLPSIELASYGPPCVAGKWGSYVIPLKDLGVLGDATLYKVVLATHTPGPDAWALDAIGFQ
jgi:hypothetical protein